MATAAPIAAPAAAAPVEISLSGDGIVAPNVTDVFDSFDTMSLREELLVSPWFCGAGARGGWR